MSVIATIENEQLKKDVTEFSVGDTVKVHTRVIEGDKERIQIYSGIVIGRKGTGINANFTVRRISYGEGVERVFPIHSPRIAKIEVERRGAVRRAKLNYLRDRKGKSATTVKEKSDRA
jgi:large subunit ribosomal protein L19